MPLCFHRWSTIKRWKDEIIYHVIQRCRRCDTWIRRDINLEDLSMKTLAIGQDNQAPTAKELPSSQPGKSLKELIQLQADGLRKFIDKAEEAEVKAFHDENEKPS